jgi:hypothetical protein
MFINTLKIILLLLLVPTLLFSDIGKIIAKRGDVQILRNTKYIPANIGTALLEKDSVVSKSNAKAQILFKDETIVTIGKDAVFKIDEYLFEQGKEPKITMSFAKGAFRSITGKIGKIAPKKFKLKTKTATMGIRGTQILFKTDGAHDEIACTEGSISVEGTDGTQVEVKAGSITTVDAGKAPTPPRAYEPEEIEDLGDSAGGGGETVDAKAVVQKEKKRQETVAKEDKQESKEEKEEQKEKTQEDSKEENQQDDSKSETKDSKGTAGESSSDNKDDTTSGSNDDSANGGEKQQDSQTTEDTSGSNETGSQESEPSKQTQSSTQTQSTSNTQSSTPQPTSTSVETQIEVDTELEVQIDVDVEVAEFDLEVIDDILETTDEQTVLAEEELLEDNKEDELEEEIEVQEEIKAKADIEQVADPSDELVKDKNVIALPSIDPKLDPYVSWGFWVNNAALGIDDISNLKGARVYGDITPQEVVARYMQEQVTAQYLGKVDGFVNGVRMQNGALDLNFNFGQANGVSGSLGFDAGSDQWRMAVERGSISKEGYVFEQISTASGSSVDIDSAIGSGHFYGPDLEAIGGTFEAKGAGQTATGIMIGAKQ